MSTFRVTFQAQTTAGEWKKNLEFYLDAKDQAAADRVRQERAEAWGKAHGFVKVRFVLAVPVERAG